MTLLEVRRLSKRFGGLTAVDMLDFDLAPGRITALIGPNGAGKTTTFNLIAGAMSVTSGSISMNGAQIAGLPPHLIARLGIFRTFQRNMPFASLSVLENVMIGAHLRAKADLVSLVTRPRQRREAEMDVRQRAEAMLDFVGLRDVIGKNVMTLSFGQGRLLEVARALAGQPKIILLDEPAAGLTAAECYHLAGVLRAVSASGVALLLIEHDMQFLLPIADWVVVLNFGKKLAEGTSAAIREDASVIDAYLGSAARQPVSTHA
jgi:ABC-type branched-subunit amino acid transport system ATPase component